MRRQIEKLYPTWLKQIDHSLLLNNPVLWGSRLHIVAFFSAIYISICVGIAYMAPASFSEVADPDLFLMYGFWGSALAALVWVRSASYFRVERHLGHEQRKSSGKAQVYALIAAVLLASGPILGSWVYVQRVESLSTLEQLIEDANLLNRGEHSVRDGQFHAQYDVNHQYNVYGNLFTDHATYWKAGAVYKIVKNASEAQKEAFVSTYAQIYTRYGVERLIGNGQKFNINHQVSQRLRILGKAEQGAFEVQKINFYLGTLLVLMYVLFTVKILYQLTRRHAFFAVLMGFALAMLTGVFGMMGFSGVHPFSKEVGFFMLWGTCLAVTAFSRKGGLSPNLTKPLLAVVAFTSPMILFGVADMTIESLWSCIEAETAIYITLSVAALGGLILWNQYFEPRFIATEVAPKGK